MNTQWRKTLVLAGLMVTNGAFADEAKDQATIDASHSDKTEVSRERAREATETATSDALASLAEHNRLDLDIRLIGPTSETVAGDR